MKLFSHLSTRVHALICPWQGDFVKYIAKDKPPEWMLKRIESDLQPFAKISEEMLDETMQIIEAKTRGLYVRYSIKNNRLFVLKKPQVICKRFRWIHAAVSAICRNAAVPGVEFIVCLEDALDEIAFPAPILAFAKRSCQKGVLMPDMDALSPHVPKRLYDVKQGIKRYPWNKKKDVAFWRGATTGAVFSRETFLTLPRARAVTSSLLLPDLIDARFTDLVQTQDVESIQKRYASYFSSPSSIKNHLEYKYQLLIDGNTCAYSRTYWQLFSNCAIFKQSSDHIQWFYALLQPYIHYIPLKPDLRDLEEKILWAKNHDEELQAMIARAQELAQSCLTPSSVHYYLYLLLLHMGFIQSSSPKGTLQSACGSLPPMSHD